MSVYQCGAEPPLLGVCELPQSNSGGLMCMTFLEARKGRTHMSTKGYNVNMFDGNHEEIIIKICHFCLFHEEIHRRLQ